MSTEPEISVPAQRWKAPQVYAMSSVCLVLGLLLGYLFRDSGSSPGPVAQSVTAQPGFMHPASTGAVAQPTPTLARMKHMADKQAEPLLAKLKDDPKNASLLNQIGTIYRSTHQFKEAASYYEKALQIAPKNVAARTDMASCLYYEGDVDGALAQLQKSLQYEPKDANTLFNLGMIRWQGKKNATGAVAAWNELLRWNPMLAESKRAEVKKLVAQVEEQSGAN